MANGDRTPLFEICDTAGPATDLLVKDDRLERAFADSLGAANLTLLTGHGSTVVAPLLKLVVYRTVCARGNSKLKP